MSAIFGLQENDIGQADSLSLETLKRVSYKEERLSRMSENARLIDNSSWYPPLYDIPLAIGPFDHFLFSRPIPLNASGWSGIDFRYGVLYPEEEKMHTGVDLTADLRQPVLAAGDGKVVFSGYGLLNGGGDKEDPYGIAVMIRHSFGYDGYDLYTVYAHLEKTTVENGEWVKNGQEVGRIGMTGLTTGPHLHFEVRLQKGEEYRLQNPELWLVPAINHGVLTGRIMNDHKTLLNSKKLWLKSIETGKSFEITTYSYRVNDRDMTFMENYSLSDLPAGSYEISTYFNYKYFKETILILPGAVNYVNLDGQNGFLQSNPTKTSLDFLN